MPWWGWIVIGVFLMGAEMGAVDAAFYLIFIGFSAIVVGLLGLMGLSLPIWAQWTLFSVIAFVSMYFFREALYKKLRGGLPGFGRTDVGEIVVAEDDIAPGQKARVQLRGSHWTATNVGSAPIAKDSKALIVEAQGLELKVEALQSEQ